MQTRAYMGAGGWRGVSRKRRPNTHSARLTALSCLMCARLSRSVLVKRMFRPADEDLCPSPHKQPKEETHKRGTRWLHLGGTMEGLSTCTRCIPPPFSPSPPFFRCGMSRFLYRYTTDFPGAHFKRRDIRYFILFIIYC